MKIKNLAKFLFAVIAILFVFSVAFGNTLHGDFDHKRYKENNWNKDYDPTQKFVHLQTTKNNVILTWDAIEDIPADDLEWDSKSYDDDTLMKLEKAKVIGYLVYLYSKNRDGDLKNSLNEVPEDNYSTENEKAYFTQQRCINLPDLEYNKKYGIRFRFILEGGSANDTAIGYKRFIDPPNSKHVDLDVRVLKYEFMVDKEYKQSKKKNDCDYKVNKITLEELYKNKAKYYNTFFVLQGYIDRHIQNRGDEKVKKILINDMDGRSDDGITDNSYSIYIGGLGQSFKEQLFYFHPKVKEVEVLVYFRKLNNPNGQEGYTNNCSKILVLKYLEK